MSGSENHQEESFRSRRLTLDDFLKGLKDLSNDDLAKVDDYLKGLRDLSDDDLAKVRNHIILDLMSFLILLFLQQLHASAVEEFTNRTGKPRKPT